MRAAAASKVEENTIFARPRSASSSEASTIEDDGSNIGDIRIQELPILEWSVHDVASWLEGAGMPEYSEDFVANDIDGELLVELVSSAEALEDVGVLSG